VASVEQEVETSKAITALAHGLKIMSHLGLGKVFVAALGLAFLTIPHNEAYAQKQQATCSWARSLCGRQPVCQRRYEACIRTGCWAVWRLRKCGYAKQ
jgi:hypothetical protein